MPPNPELQHWASIWEQTEVGTKSVEARILSTACRQHRHMRWMVIGELTLSTLVIAQALHFLQLYGRPWLGFVGIIILAVLVFQSCSLWLRRGLWNAQLLDGMAALHYLQRRARFRLRLVWLNLASLPLMWAILLPLFVDLWERTPRSFLLMLIAQLAVTGAALVWAWRTRRQALTEAVNATRLLQEFVNLEC